MVDRRGFVLGSGTVLTAALAGCTAIPGTGGVDPHPVERFVPQATAVSEYGPTLRDNEYTVWSVDAAALRSEVESLSEDARSQFDVEIPARHGVSHSEFGIEYGAVDDIVFLGTPEINAVPRGVDHLGRLVASITVGDFDQGDVVDAVGDEFRRNDDGEVVVFSDGDLSYAAGDGWLVCGFDPVVRTIVDTRRDNVQRYVAVTPAIESIVTTLADATFLSATKHDRHERTDVEDETIEGQVAEGFGYDFTGETASIEAVLVFEDAAVVDEEAVTEWAQETLLNVPEPTVAADGATVTITGDTDTDVLRYATIAFLPFSFATGSEQSTT
ncbi:hypothetical protein SVXHr_2428 [Halorhabdus sp. SVX81]|uniref:hypothetical protein n=1 Tax=Halorhabdus sp. SVX81 TaxID=2978283 RepID=UPI0023DA566E|nr:hypothetical protein [Halorhabdus sp. SVX81]WEL18578.1 hypothetical protein SVXHr_2428 [Halorhabdus sp. SVX81]